MNPPYCSVYQNLVDSWGSNQDGIKCQDAKIYQYFARYLLQRAMSVFKPTAPEHWEESYFMYVLFVWGYFAVLNTDRYGVIPQQCTLGGWNVQYMPSFAVISNPLFRDTYELTIGEGCSIIRLQPDFGGISDIVAYYANMLALAAESVHINFFNSHLAYVFAAQDKAVAQSYRAMYDSIGQGKPYVIIDKNLFDDDGNPTWQKFDNDIKSTYIATDLLQDMRTIITMFDEELGIPSNNNPKKERMIVDEVNSNNVATYTRMDMCLDQLKKSCKEAQRLFGIELDFNWRYKPDTGGDKVAGSTSDNTGPVQMGQ